MNPANQQDTVIVVSTILTAWGGCEDLWSKTVPLLQNRGYHVVVCKHQIDRDYPKIASHIQQGVEFWPTHKRKSLGARAFQKVVRKLKQVLHVGNQGAEYHFGRSDEVLRFAKYIKTYRAKLVLISQGANFEGLGYAYACMVNKVPYVIVSHKAIDFYWPPQIYRAGMRTVLGHSRGCYFVSKHNKALTEEQFGFRLPESRVIFNPVKPTDYIPYPGSHDAFQLCCIGRLFLVEKGQDILIRALSKAKWKNRPIRVVIIGSGPDEETLKEMAALVGATNVLFYGEVADIYQVWKCSHALVLPSRTEGLPLVIVEAMMAGRPVITTDVGGNGELLEEGVTGFIGHASDKSFDETLERAWARRAQWEEMGKQAAVAIRNSVPDSPERIFADLLENHIHEQ